MNIYFIGFSSMGESMAGAVMQRLNAFVAAGWSREDSSRLMAVLECAHA